MTGSVAKTDLRQTLNFTSTNAIIREKPTPTKARKNPFTSPIRSIIINDF